ncbi:hypothetical protein RHMOL_Rhmol07G0276800 [Rhododendron molle]|uniref:Uncharacterized protein n=1 Tax=Rhododendron molle TaxID=49168 RepID=A0ACC0N6H7_RHOML|nr:hypothetical protein RHMOL_Rhmol07G0276800 [Rhododendron molle]
MDLVVPTKQTHEGFCSFHSFHGRIGSRVCSNLSSLKVFVGPKARFLVLSIDSGTGLRTQEGFRKKRRNRVYAVSKIEAFSSDNGRCSISEKTQSGRPNQVNSVSSRESKGNKDLLRLVRKGELEECFRRLESMVSRGDIPDIIPCTNLIRGFCQIGNTEKATRVMQIVEESGPVLFLML